MIMKSSVLFLSMMLFTVMLVACEKATFGYDKPPVTPEKPDTVKPAATVETCEKCLVVSEQYKDRVAILDVNSGKFIWEWTPQISNVAPEHYAWFRLIDEAKPVYNRKYILLTATSGAIAIVRISDKKTVWYAYTDGKPHSAELLPDGNVVSANATAGTLTFFAVDTLVRGANVKKRIYELGEGHNVVWDNRRNVLWMATKDRLKSFAYNNNCQDPYLGAEMSSAPLPGSLPHDLFPVYGKDALWLSVSHNIYQFDIATSKFTLQTSPLQNKVKSLSSGPDGFPIVVIQGKADYWTDEIKDINGARIYQEDNLKIYKSRWFLENTFSYTAGANIRQCR
jgi:hypothetical protein